MDSSNASSTGGKEPPHSCSLCPQLELELDNVPDHITTVSVRFAQMVSSAQKGCYFLKARLDRLMLQISPAISDTSPDIDWAAVWESSLEMDICHDGGGRRTVFCEWEFDWLPNYFGKEILLVCPTTGWFRRHPSQQIVY